MISEQEYERPERSALRAWLRRTFVVAGLALTGWLLFGGSAAEAASTGSGEAASEGSAGSAALAAIIATGVAPGGDGIVEQTAARTTHLVVARSPQRSRPLDSAFQPVESTGRQTAGRVDPPAGAGSAGRAASTAVSTVGSTVGLSGTDLIGSDATPTLGLVTGTARPVLVPVDEVTSAIPGEPGVGSPRETPGSGVEAPRTSTAFGSESFSESLAASADAARPSSGSSPVSRSRGQLFQWFGAGTADGPAVPQPVSPVPGPSHDVPDGTATSGSGHGSVDRGHGVATDIAPFVVAPQLISSLPATSRSTGHPDRATRPSVSPD